MTGKNQKHVHDVKGTIKQRAAIAGIVVSRGVLRRAMLAAGYTEKSAKNPKNLTESKAYRQALPDIIERLKEERDRAIKQMGVKIGRAKYRDMVEAVDKLTKNIQLLSGGKTENEGLTIEWEK